MPISRYEKGFTDGVTIREIPYVTTQNGNGNTFWVDSNKGSDGNKGTFIRPFATIDYAVGRCTANNGDLIVVAAGHTESVIAASGLDLDVAGITIVFEGEGAQRATIDFGTAVTASITVAAANITLVNPRFTASIDALTGPISITAANFKLVNGEYYDGTSIDTTDCIVATATATGLKVYGWKYTIGDEAGTQKQSNIQLNGVDNAEFVNIDIAGDFATGNIENITDEVLNVRFENIKLKNSNATPKPGIILDANATGQAKNVDIRIASGTTYVSNLAKLNWDLQCLGYAADGTGGDPIGTAGTGTIEGKVDTILAQQAGAAGVATYPAAAPAANGVSMAEVLRHAAEVAGEDTADNTFDSSNVVANRDGSLLERTEFIMDEVSGTQGIATFPAGAQAANNVSIAEVLRYAQEAVRNGSGTALDTDKSLVDAVGSNGTTLTYGAGSALGAVGTVHVVSKTLVSSNITQAGVDITGASSVGALMIEDIHINTDATGLATGTNFKIDTDNANGVTTLFEETVANLGANKTESLTTGSVAAVTGGILESGKKLIAKSTVADCTGAGTINIVIKFRRVVAGATVAAA